MHAWDGYLRNLECLHEKACVEVVKILAAFVHAGEQPRFCWVEVNGFDASRALKNTRCGVCVHGVSSSMVQAPQIRRVHRARDNFVVQQRPERERESRMQWLTRSRPQTWEARSRSSSLVFLYNSTPLAPGMTCQRGVRAAGTCALSRSRTESPTLRFLVGN